MNKKDKIEIYFGDCNHFNVNDVITNNNVNMKILRLPRKKKWQKCINVITFGIYTISPNYVVKVIIENDR